MAKQTSSIKFGTEGWRGIIADDFTFENVRIVSHAIANYLKKSGDPGEGVLVGYDTRAQGKLFALTACSAIHNAGLIPILCDNPSSTPAVVHALTKRKMQGAIIISASHNPPEYNGIKFKPYYGGSALNSITDKIELEITAIDRSEIKKTSTSFKPEEINVVDDYLHDMKLLVDLAAIRKSNFNIVFDAMHGAGAGSFDSFPNVHNLRQDRNPAFGGVNPEPIPQNLAALFDCFNGFKYDIGIAVDGDADRIGIIDNKRNYVDSHRVYALLFQHIVERRGMRGRVVKTVSTTRMVDKLAQIYDLPVTVTPIGFKYICEEMLHGDVLMGGEESGGIGIPLHMIERDGVFAGLLLLEAMALSGLSISELLKELFEKLGPVFYFRHDLHFNRSEMPSIRKLLREVKPTKILNTKVDKIDTLDGTKFEFKEGWLLLRASGTEPVVRVYSEASKPQQPKEWVDAGLTLISSALK